jgi:hypothetical protein
MGEMKTRRRSKGDSKRKIRFVAGSRKAAEGKEPPWALQKMPVVQRSIRLSARVFFFIGYLRLSFTSVFCVLPSIFLYNYIVMYYYTPSHQQ